MSVMPFDIIWRETKAAVSLHSYTTFIQKFSSANGAHVAKEKGISRQAVNAHCQTVRLALMRQVKKHKIVQEVAFRDWRGSGVGAAPLFLSDLGSDEAAWLALCFLTGGRARRSQQSSPGKHKVLHVLAMNLPFPCAEQALMDALKAQHDGSCQRAGQVVFSWIKQGVLQRTLTGDIDLVSPPAMIKLVQELLHTDQDGLRADEAQRMLALSRKAFMAEIAKLGIIKIGDRVMLMSKIRSPDHDERQVLNQLLSIVTSQHGQQCKLRKAIFLLQGRYPTPEQYDRYRHWVSRQSMAPGVFFYGVSGVDLISSTPFKARPALTSLLAPIKGEVMTSRALADFIGVDADKAFFATLSMWRKRGVIKGDRGSYTIQ